MCKKSNERKAVTMLDQQNIRYVRQTCRGYPHEKSGDVEHPNETDSHLVWEEEECVQKKVEVMEGHGQVG